MMSDAELDQWMQRANRDLVDGLGRVYDTEAALATLKRRMAVGARPPHPVRRNMYRCEFCHRVAGIDDLDERQRRDKIEALFDLADRVARLHRSYGQRHGRNRRNLA